MHRAYPRVPRKRWLCGNGMNGRDFPEQYLRTHQSHTNHPHLQQAFRTAGWTKLTILHELFKNRARIPLSICGVGSHSITGVGPFGRQHHRSVSIV